MSQQYTSAEIKDRGNIKWTSMMLTEHRVALSEWENTQKDVEPPDHDYDRLAEISEDLSCAKHNQMLIRMVYWKEKRHVEVNCVVKRIDPYKKAVLIEVGEYDSRWILAECIVRIDSVE